MLRLLATLAATAASAQNAKLVVVAQFKNEAESLPQWLHHYLTDEGVSTMLLVNDNSTDGWRQAKRFEEAKSLLRKTMPVARRVLGDNEETTLRMRWSFVQALYKDDAAALDDLRESVATLEDTARTAQRVFGGAHPLTKAIEGGLRDARAALAARETPSPSA